MYDITFVTAKSDALLSCDSNCGGDMPTVAFVIAGLYNCNS